MINVVGQFKSADDIIDVGVAGFSTFSIGGATHIFAYSGANGGLASYELAHNGQLILRDTAALPSGLGTTAEGPLNTASVGGGRSGLLTGAASSAGLVGWQSRAHDTIAEQLHFDLPTGFEGRMVVAASAQGTSGPVLVIDPNSGKVAAVSSEGQDAHILSAGAQTFTGLVGATAGAQTLIGGQTHLLSARRTADGNEVLSLTTYNASTQSLNETATLDQTTGFAVAHVSALSFAQVGGKSFAVIAAAGSSSLTVVEIGADGSLALRDHVLDSRDIRIGGAAALDTLMVGDRAFVVAGGADDGVTLLEVMPDGQLLARATLEDGLNSGLNNVSALQLVQQGNKLLIMVGGQSERGVTVLEWDLGQIGVTLSDGENGALVTGSGDDVVMGTRDSQFISGGAGNDVLIASANNQRLNGGAGADVFLVRQGVQTVTVNAFERGIDRFDPSGWPGLMDMSHITLTPRTGGVTLNFFGRTAHILSADGNALTLADITADQRPLNRIDPSLLLAPSEGGSPSGVGQWSYTPAPGAPPLINPREYETPTDEPGGLTTQQVLGRYTEALPDEPKEIASAPEVLSASAPRSASGAQNVSGGAGNDVLAGSGSDDELFGWQGDDIIFTYDANDLVWGGLGNDTICAAGGDDVLCGGDGDDMISGGAGQNSLWAATGNDVVHGGSGAERLGGGDGNDMLHAYGGDDIIYGGDGYDTIVAGDGNDTIWGGDGDDLIAGGAGSDSIAGGGGADHLWGNDGADRFVFYRNYGVSHLRDFDPSEGDHVALGQWLFDGDMPTITELIERHHRASEYGAALYFDDAESGLVFHGITDIADVQDYITIF